MEYIKIAVALLMAYLIGSVNLAIIFSCLKGCDIRKTGSGNPGATNISREYGVWMGILVFAFDFGKTTLSMWLGSRIVGITFGIPCGMSCLLGHCFPVYYRFHGGKGISCGAAIALMMNTQIFSCVIAVFLLSLLLSRKVSIASLTAASLFPAFAVIFSGNVLYAGFAVACSALVIWRHKENIIRLKSGTEPEFRAKR